jgi:hypothetical protein
MNVVAVTPADSRLSEPDAAAGGEVDKAETGIRAALLTVSKC